MTTGPDKWNRLGFGVHFFLESHLIYTKNTEKNVPSKGILLVITRLVLRVLGLRFIRFLQEWPSFPLPNEFFVVDMCNHLASSDFSATEFTVHLRNLVAERKLDPQVLLEHADHFGNRKGKRD